MTDMEQREQLRAREIDGDVLLQNIISKIEWARAEEAARPADADYWHGVADGLRMVRAYVEERP